MLRARYTCFMLIGLIGLAGCGGGKSDPKEDCTSDVDCNDANACTLDTCAEGQCDHQAMDCDDGDACTADTCADGQCEHQPLDCDDGDACTADTCASGQCEHQAMDCDDEDACTTDSCSSGQCDHQPLDCDDQDPCTLDSCAEASGQCVHEPDPACAGDPELVCDDGLDNDLDGDTDCADPDCLGAGHPCEDPEATCDDDFDNDGDGLTDCADDDCAGEPACPACSPAAQLACGDAIQFDYSNAASLLETYSCQDDPYPDQELVYEVVAPGDHGLRITVGTDVPLLTAPAILAMEDVCDTAACVAATDPLRIENESSLTVDAQAGLSYFFALENREFSQQTYDLQVDCVEWPLCDDGVDNEGDGLTDCDDPDCAPMAGCFCLPAPPAVGCNALLAGDLTGHPAVRDTYACDPLDWNYLGPEALHTFTAPSTGTVHLSVRELPDTYGLAVLDEACDADSAQSCLAFTNPASGPELTFTAQQGVTYTIVFDLVQAGYPGPYSVQLTCVGPEICADRFDNDLDGATDCDDTDCRDPNADPATWDPACQAEALCDDGVDNDSDGTTDCLDADCDGLVGPGGGLCELGTEATCDDGADNDGDWYTDCRDPDCDGLPGAGGLCQPDGETFCADGFDNDDSGAADCEDIRCHGEIGPDGVACESTGEQTCDDGFDNDGDGVADCLDGDCWMAANCFEWDCHNGLDDDGDGLTDCEDGNCQDPGNPDICREADCTDGLDEDLDGDTDCEDSDCDDDPDCGETFCDDGLDNDGNGLTDCQDPACTGESGPGGGICEPLREQTCGDGFDNDSDGLIDCDDPDCFLLDQCACMGVDLVACGDTLAGDWTGQPDRIGHFPCLDVFSSGPETFYQFTAAADGPVQIRDSAGPVSELVFVVLDDRCDPLDQAGCIAGTLPPVLFMPDISLTAPVTFNAQAGQTYYLVVDSVMDGPSDYQADIVCPDQQLCSPAPQVQCDQQVSGTLAAATLQSWCGGMALPPGSGQAFYSYTAAADGQVEISINRGQLMTMLDLCNPDTCFGIATSSQSFEFSAQAGTTYYFGLMDSQPGLSFSLALNCQ